MHRRPLVLIAALVFFLSTFSGCAYLKNRGNDALDAFDIGLTVSSKPGFALFIAKPWVLPLGVSYVDGKSIGLGRSRFGVHDFRQKGVGYLVGGALQRGVENYDPKDPADPEWYDMGLLGYLKGTTMEQVYPAQRELGRPKTRPSCPATVHLGWIGFDLNCKFWDLVDFFLGWTTIDIGHDDIGNNHELNTVGIKGDVVE